MRALPKRVHTSAVKHGATRGTRHSFGLHSTDVPTLVFLRRAESSTSKVVKNQQDTTITQSSMTKWEKGKRKKKHGFHLVLTCKTTTTTTTTTTLPYLFPTACCAKLTHLFDYYTHLAQQGRMSSGKWCLKLLRRVETWHDSYLSFRGMAPDLLNSHGRRHLFTGEGRRRGEDDSCFWHIEMEDRQLNELLNVLFSLSSAW